MRRLAFVAFVVALLTAFVAPPANAYAGERLGCFVNIGRPGAYSEGCIAERPQFTYNVHFSVLNTGAGPYTYSWDLTGWERVVTGCTPSLNSCVVFTRAPNGSDVVKPMSVTFTNLATGETGASTTSVWMLCVVNFGGSPAFC